jgi:hypothetical protein
MHELAARGRNTPLPPAVAWSQDFAGPASTAHTALRCNEHVLHHMRTTWLQSIDNIFVAWRPDLSSLGILVARTVPYNTPMYPTGAHTLMGCVLST